MKCDYVKWADIPERHEKKDLFFPLKQKVEVLHIYIPLTTITGGTRGGKLSKAPLPCDELHYHLDGYM